MHTVVTSPPYYGLRAYQIPPTIWGGAEICEHQWGDGVRLTGRGSGFQGKNGERATRAMPEQRETIRDRGNVCTECGAWRGHLGLEPTYEAFVEHTVEVFREVWRVLRKDGTCWLNLGDSYATGGGSVGRHPGGGKRGENWGLRGIDTSPNRMPQSGLKPKDMIGIPWRVAFALQADGWWLRQEIIWNKSNPMPSSVRDRCTPAHESMFLLAKNGVGPLVWRHDRHRLWAYKRPPADYVWRHRQTGEVVTDTQSGEEWTRINLWRGFDYYFDQDAIAESCSPNTHARLSQDVQNQIGSVRAHAGGRPNGNMKAVAPRYREPTGWDTSDGDGRHGTIHREGRGLRKTDSTNASHVPGASAHGGIHRAGTPRGGRKLGDREDGIRNNDSFEQATCLPVMRRNKRSVWEIASEPFSDAHFATFPTRLIEPCILAGCPEGGTVLDPFGGSGTVGLVAARLHRNAILIELGESYVAMAQRRITADAPLLADTSVTQQEAAE